MTITEAKKRLQDDYRDKEGFVGVGISTRNDKKTLRVYVIDAGFPIAQQLAKIGQFEGFPIEIKVSGKIQAFI